MAAVFGIIATEPGIDLDALLPRMQARQAHRAPDGFTHWRQEGCALAHGALHVGTPPAQATQPLRLRDGRICVTDGFVANHDDVCRALGIDVHVALDDAQLLALAVERWGAAFTEHVHGEFVLALWDPQARVLDLYRDHLGARPICYVQTPTLFAFASSSLALLHLPGVATGLDPLSIVGLWYGNATYLKRDGTAFEGIRLLVPGHRLTWRAGEAARLTPYWRLHPRDPIRRRDEGEYIEEFREVFGNAVARAMRGSRGTALMLSGGIDSAAILAARRGFRENGVADDLCCISAVLAAGDDTPWAQEENRNILTMTRHHPRKLQFQVPVRDESASLVNSADLAEAAWSFIHPSDMSLLVPSLACGLAKREGCRLVLNGTDGDNITHAGVYYIDGLMRAGQVGRAWKESVQASRVNTYLQGNSPVRLFGRAMLAALEPAVSRHARDRRRTQRDILGIDTHPMMSPTLAKAVDLPDRLRAASALRGGEPEQLRCDHLVYWLGFSLSCSEGIASKHGTETRHPWCDLRVLEFFRRLPVEFVVRYGWTKWVVRQACEPALGSDVVWHSGKRHLGSLLNRQVLQSAAPYLYMLLCDEREKMRCYIREAALERAVAILADPRHITDEECDSVITIAALAGWVRQLDSYLKQAD